MIEVCNLSFSYRQDPALSGIHLTVEAGEIFGIVGPNGSGKSTLLKVLSGLLQGFTGAVKILGKDLRACSPRELATRVAVVPQETHAAFPFTALEIVLMGRAPYLGGMSLEGERDLEIARAAMIQTDSFHLAHRSIQELSGGEKQRVVVARALAQQAPLLLLDEPTAFLDIRHQVEVCELLQQLCRERSLAVVVVFHDLNLASMYCHRLLLLSQGRGVHLGPPGDVLTYANIRAVYGVDVYVGINDLTGVPYYMPMQLKRERPDR